MMIKRRIVLGCPLLLALILACGCSGGKGANSSVQGKVTYNQQVVSGGTIAFYPTAEGQSGPWETHLGADGTYTITDMPAGDYTVTVETESIKRTENAPVYGGGRGGPAKGQEKQGRGGMSPAPPDRQGGAEEKYVSIPPKYGKKESTTLKTTVGKGKNTYDPVLTD
jgi:hypothetical protein